jgi:hypothetical protein
MKNRFVVSDMMYSPESAYTYIICRQPYAGYDAEEAMVTSIYKNVLSPNDI